MFHVHDQGSSFAAQLYQDAIFAYQAGLTKQRQHPFNFYWWQFVDAKTKLAYTAMDSGAGKCLVKRSIVNASNGVEDDGLDARMCKQNPLPWDPKVVDPT